MDDEWSLWFWAEAFPDKILVSGSFLRKILPGLTFLKCQCCEDVRNAVKGLLLCIRAAGLSYSRAECGRNQNCALNLTRNKIWQQNLAAHFGLSYGLDSRLVLCVVSQHCRGNGACFWNRLAQAKCSEAAVISAVIYFLNALRFILFN